MENGYASMVKAYMKPDLGGYKKTPVDGKFGKHILVYMLVVGPMFTYKGNFLNGMLQGIRCLMKWNF